MHSSWLNERCNKQVDTWEASQALSSELTLSTPADIPMAKASPMVKLHTKGPLEELQSHVMNDGATKGR